MLRLSSVLSAVSLAVCSMASQASAIYTYDSANYTDFADAPYTSAMHLHFQFQLADALAIGTTNGVNSLPGFQFTAYDDGVFHSVAPGLSFQYLNMTIDASGNVSDWLISLATTDYGAVTGGPTSGQQLVQVIDFGTRTSAGRLGANGTWTIQATPATVPEPGSIALVGAALAGLGIATRRVRHKAS